MKLKCALMLLVMLFFIPVLSFAGNMVDVNSVKAKAETGNSDAMYGLGYMYEHGKGVPQDYKGALKWYMKAADAGQSIAMHNLGWMYEHGEGVVQNYKKAVTWYTKAADVGQSLTMYSLGSMYEHGKGVPQDYAVSYMWFNLAASIGHFNDAATACDRLRNQMTVSQLEKGQQLTRTWLAQHPSLQSISQKHAIN